MTSRPDDGDKRLLVTFRLGGDRYAFDIHRVREVVECGDVTRVPRAPTAVRGVLNLRGGVVPVVDLAVPLGLPPTKLAKRTCVVVVELREGDEAAAPVGMLADAIDRVLEVPVADVGPARAAGARIPLGYLLGVANVGDDFVLILDVAGLFAGDEMHGEHPRSAADAAPARTR